MKEIQSKSGKMLVVSTDEAYLINAIDEGDDKYSIRFVNCPEINNIKYINYLNNLQVLGKLSELTNKDCEEFVEINKEKDTFRDYQGLRFEDEVIHPYFDYKHAKFSFISLLQSEGIDVSKEWLIIKVL